MNSHNDYKLKGINIWFVIEVLSFYGYILSAVLFVLINGCRSSLGWLNKDNIKDRFKYDFIEYHQKDLHWAAFV